MNVDRLLCLLGRHQSYPARRVVLHGTGGYERWTLACARGCGMTAQHTMTPNGRHEDSTGWR